MELRHLSLGGDKVKLHPDWKDMPEWTKEKLEQLITDCIEESLGLEYKAAGALEKTDAKKSEITKDVSAFANSSGGNLIYGISEFREKDKRHLPEKLDPIDRRSFSKECLEQVIQSIQPKIDGVIIHAVCLKENSEEVCYVVEVPQSQTAHQARDRLYYKRHNFNVLAMEDYELRDVMNRRKHPKIEASIQIRLFNDFMIQEGIILIKLENKGKTIAHHVMAEVEIPIKLSGYIRFDDSVKLVDGPNGSYWKFRINQSNAPLFPDSTLILEKPFHTNPEILDRDARRLESTNKVKVKIYADEAPKIGAIFDFENSLNKWFTLAQNQ